MIVNMQKCGKFFCQGYSQTMYFDFRINFTHINFERHYPAVAQYTFNMAAVTVTSCILICGPRDKGTRSFESGCQ